MEIEAAALPHETKKEEKVIEERKEKILSYFKKNPNWIFYVILAILVKFAYWIRTLNLSTLKDVTTGGWTLGPDLDPFLFLRWAENIVANGSLFAIDTFRYVPLGYNTKLELILLPYSIAWFHKFLSIFGLTDSVTHSAVIYPAFMFALTVIAFFLLARKIFSGNMGNTKSNIIALIAAFFLTIIPSLIPRTIAGIPEKESAAFFFMFLAFYFFICSWKEPKNVKSYIFALLAGISTSCMALIWGGFAYIFITIGLSFLIGFFLEQVNLKKYIIYTIWLFTSFVIMYPFSIRYQGLNLFTSSITGFAFSLFIIVGIHLILFKTNLKSYSEKYMIKSLPPQISSFIAAAILGLIFIILFFGFDFITSRFGGIMNNLVTPVSSRLGVTVAENKQPFFGEWADNFGPVLQGVPIFFWMFFIGSIFLFHYLVRDFHNKERWYLTASYFVFLTCLVFSRYKPESILNGTNGMSLFVYALGFAAMLGTIGYYYYNEHKKKEDDKLKRLDVGIILLFALFFFSIVSARGAVRVILVLVPSASIIGAYFIVASVNSAIFNKGDEMKKMFAWIIAVLVILGAILSIYTFYGQAKSVANSYGPSEYTHQWQYAMQWVRQNTPENAVFGHWWDYGYWLQSIGNRATVLDGGNQYEYWDYLMGRYGLTAPTSRESLDFLYAHNTTHFLIDSTDIGKYSAFSSIGSDENYDRASWIPAFVKDTAQVKETKNGFIYLYSGGAPLDADIIYEQNGSKIFLPGGKAGIGAVTLEVDTSGNLLSQPMGVFVYQNNRYDLPMRYGYSNNKFTDFGSGIESGVYVMPQLLQDAQGTRIDNSGAILYLSNRTVKSQVARLYLYKDDDQFYKLVHSEDDFVVKQLKANNVKLNNDVIYYGGVRGPIRIWEIHYPNSMQLKPEYLETQYPDDALRTSR